MIRFIPILFALACADQEPQTAGTPDRERQPDLELPDTAGVDFVAAYADALSSLLEVNTSKAWSGHEQSLGYRQDGCPDIYAGPPEDADIDADPGEGLSWSDFCETNGGLSYGGHVFWANNATAQGLISDPTGRVTTGDRRLDGRATVAHDDDLLFEFSGEASDSVYVSEGEGYETWTYTTLVEGTVSGSDIFAETLTPDGWRTDLYLFYSGGDADRLEARGNVYLFDGRIHDRFDSIVVDMELVGEVGRGPDDCILEPRGYIGLRDSNAYWYDLVFLPRYEDDLTNNNYPNDPLSVCDGCGTLYIRGVKTEEVCVDFSSVFAGGLTRPAIEEYVLTLHDLP